MSDDAEKLVQGSDLASAQRLDHPLTLGIGGIGCDTVSEGASAYGDCFKCSNLQEMHEERTA